MPAELEFENFFNERVKERGLNLKKLSEVSGIAVKHIEALANGNFGNLPSAPYFRGYLQKLGEVLDFDWEIWWARFKTSGLVKDAGPKDLPPRNRFLRPIIYKNIWFAAIVIVVFLYFVFQAAKILGRPTIIITHPAQNPATVSNNEIEIAGNVKNGSELYVNGEFVQVAKDGSWQKDVLLENGLNSLQITAKKFLGGETRVVQQILYEATSVQ